MRCAARLLKSSLLIAMKPFGRAAAGKMARMESRSIPRAKRFQQFMRRQQEDGKLLVVCSKNDGADVDAVFSRGAPMPLKREHIAAWRVNWRPKSENLKSIAHELNLGLESFIFIDDNPIECAEIEAHCPEVVTLRLPEDVNIIPRFLENCWAFDQPTITREDQERNEMYRQNRLREDFQSQAMTFADFIAGLDLEVKIALVESNDFSRVSQLTQRTNQFNVSGKRRTESDLRQLSDEMKIWTVAAKDRFGDYGLVGVLIFSVKEKSVVVDTFLLSCRALGKGVEHRMLAELGNHAVQIGALWVDIPFVNLPCNQPALDFLESVGAADKQSRDNSLYFHFPANVARRRQVYHAANLFRNRRQRAESNGTPISPSSGKFSKYRAIALDSLDIAKIHERIEVSTRYFVPRRTPRVLLPKPKLNARFANFGNDCFASSASVSKTIFLSWADILSWLCACSRKSKS